MPLKDPNTGIECPPTNPNEAATDSRASAPVLAVADVETKGTRRCNQHNPLANDIKTRISQTESDSARPIFFNTFYS